MQNSEVGLDMPRAGAERSALSRTHITKSEILEKVESEQLRLGLSSTVDLALDYSDVLIDDTGSICFTWVENPIPAVTDGRSVEVKVTIPDLTSGSPLSDSVRQALRIPETLELRPFSNAEVIELIGEVLEFDVSSLRMVSPGVGCSAVRLTSFGPRTLSGVYACVEAELTVTIGCMNVYPMSVSNFGNFLLALKLYGQDTALATLHQIYSEAA